MDSPRTEVPYRKVDLPSQAAHEQTHPFRPGVSVLFGIGTPKTTSKGVGSPLVLSKCSTATTLYQVRLFCVLGIQSAKQIAFKL